MTGQSPATTSEPRAGWSLVGPGLIVAGLVPRIPEGGLINVLSVAGGVGGTITLAAYGYWIREKGWTTPGHMRVMRLDSTVAYTVTGIFVISTLIVGAELLYSAGIAVDTGDQGLLDLSEVLRDRYGAWAGTVFLVGFWSAAMSSLVGVWNGVSMMFADFMPFLAITLLWMLNTDRTPKQWRNGPVVNVLMAICAALFIWLAATQLQGAVERAFGG